MKTMKSLMIAVAALMLLPTICQAGPACLKATAAPPANTDFFVVKELADIYPNEAHINRAWRVFKDYAEAYCAEEGPGLGVHENLVLSFRLYVHMAGMTERCLTGDRCLHQFLAEHRRNVLADRRLKEVDQQREQLAKRIVEQSRPKR